MARRHSPNLTLFILAVAAVSYVLQQTLVVPALREIQTDLGTTTTWGAWVFTGFLLTSAIFTPILGKLGDMYGKKRLLVVAMAAFLIGTVGAALADSITLLIVARAVQGVGGAVFPLSFGIIRDELPADRVGVGLGLLSATFGVGGGAGLVLSGVVLDALSWQWLFWIGAIPVAISLVLLVLLIPESPLRTPARIDWVGAFLLSVGLGALLVALSEGAAWGWLSTRTLGVVALSVAVLVMWIVVELRVREPLVDIGMMRDPSVFWTNLVGLVTGFAMFGTFLLVPQLVQMPHGLPPQAAAMVHYGFDASVTRAGLYLLPSSVVMLLIGPATGIMERRVGARPLLGLGLVVLTLGAVALVFMHGVWWGIVLAMGLIGAGVGMSYSMLAKLIVDAVPQAVTGVAMGMNTVMRTIGGVVGGQVGAAVLTSMTIGATQIPSEGAFTTMFALSGAAALVAALGTLRIPSGRGRVHEIAVTHHAASTPGPHATTSAQA